MQFEGRLSYLSHLGVSNWFARHHLAGARPSSYSSQLQQRFDGVQKDIPPPLKLQPNRYAIDPQFAPKHIARVDPSKVMHDAPEPAEEAGESVTERRDVSVGLVDEQLSAVSLRAFQLADVLITSEGCDVGLLAMEQQFLRNLLLACGVKNVSANYCGDLSFPVFNNPLMSHLPGAGSKDVLSRFLVGCVSVPVRLHLHFGGTLAALVAESLLETSADGRAKYQSLVFDNPLSAVFASPTLKAKLWRYVSEQNLLRA